MNHLEFAAHESAQLDSHPQERYVDRVERLVRKHIPGFDLDGDGNIDGYCIDWTGDAYHKGIPVDVYADTILSVIDSRALDAHLESARMEP